MKRSSPILAILSLVALAGCRSSSGPAAAGASSALEPDKDVGSVTCHACSLDVASSKLTYDVPDFVGSELISLVVAGCDDRTTIPVGVTIAKGSSTISVQGLPTDCCFGFLRVGTATAADATCAFKASTWDPDQCSKYEEKLCK